MRGYQTHALDGDAVSHGMKAAGAERLETVAERIHARCCRQMRRQGAGQDRIADHLYRQHRRMKHDDLACGLFIDDHA